MNFFRKNIHFILFALFVLASRATYSQNFGETKEHKRMWHKWSKKSDAFNPYVKHGKSTHEQSKKDAKENKKILKQQEKEIKKQKRKLIKQGKLHKAKKR